MSGHETKHDLDQVAASQPHWQSLIPVAGQLQLLVNRYIWFYILEKVCLWKDFFLTFTSAPLFPAWYSYLLLNFIVFALGSIPTSLSYFEHFDHGPFSCGCADLFRLAFELPFYCRPPKMGIHYGKTSWSVHWEQREVISPVSHSVVTGLLPGMTYIISVSTVLPLPTITVMYASLPIPRPNSLGPLECFYGTWIPCSFPSQ